MELSACANGASTSTVRNVNTAKIATNPIRKMTNVGLSVRSVPRPGGRSGGAERAREREHGEDRDEPAEHHHPAAGEIRERDPVRALALPATGWTNPL